MGGIFAPFGDRSLGEIVDDFALDAMGAQESRGGPLRPPRGRKKKRRTETGVGTLENLWDFATAEDVVDPVGDLGEPIVKGGQNLLGMGLQAAGETILPSSVGELGEQMQRDALSPDLEDVIAGSFGGQQVAPPGAGEAMDEVIAAGAAGGAGAGTPSPPPPPGGQPELSLEELDGDMVARERLSMGAMDTDVGATMPHWESGGRAGQMAADVRARGMLDAKYDQIHEGIDLGEQRKDVDQQRRIARRSGEIEEQLLQPGEGGGIKQAEDGTYYNEPEGRTEGEIRQAEAAATPGNIASQIMGSMQEQIADLEARVALYEENPSAGGGLSREAAQAQRDRLEKFAAMLIQSYTGEDLAGYFPKGDSILDKFIVSQMAG